MDDDTFAFVGLGGAVRVYVVDMGEVCLESGPVLDYIPVCDV